MMQSLHFAGNGQEVPLVTIIASAIGAVVGLLLLAIAATIILLLRYKYRSRKQHHKKPQSNNLRYNYLYRI